MPRKGKATELAEWISSHGVARIGEAEFAELLTALAPVSSGYLRRLVRLSGVELSPLVAGVRQEDLTALEASLTGLLAEYEAGNAARKRQVRKLLIEAKDHARFALKKHPEKEEVVLWLLMWLENPPLFPDWVALRKTSKS